MGQPTHTVKRTFPNRREVRIGEQVDASGWRNARMLERQGYIVPIEKSVPIEIEIELDSNAAEDLGVSVENAADADEIAAGEQTEKTPEEIAEEVITEIASTEPVEAENEITLTEAKTDQPDKTLTAKSSTAKASAAKASVAKKAPVKTATAKKPAAKTTAEKAKK